MKKMIRSLTAVIAMAILVSACQSYDDISMVLGADVNSAKVISKGDDHGGFHGDGERYIEFEFEDDTFEDTIKEDNTWHALPMKDDTVTALLYGLETPEMTYGPYLEHDIPKVEEGYYFFYDRHSESKDPFDTSKVLDRSSLNFTVAVYDAEADKLYYTELDT